MLEIRMTAAEKKIAYLERKIDTLMEDNKNLRHLVEEVNGRLSIVGWGTVAVQDRLRSLLETLKKASLNMGKPEEKEEPN